MSQLTYFRMSIKIFLKSYPHQKVAELREFKNFFTKSHSRFKQILVGPTRECTEKMVMC